MDIKKSLEEIKKNLGDLRHKSLEDWKKILADIKHLDFHSLDKQLQEQLGWLWQRYKPAKILTFLGILVIVVGILGTGFSIALLAHLFFIHTPLELILKARFELMVSVLRTGLFIWILVTGFGIVTRRRWAGVSCMIGYILVQSQSVYVSGYFLASIVLSLAAYIACFIVQLHWEVLMVNVEEDIPLECNHEYLKERAKGFDFWGYYTFCPGCNKRIFFWDNLLSPIILLLFSLVWATWWYWPILPHLGL
ncbi:MAG: hypothetical protein D6785_16535 [Planctomycetota bacterium]|nr:MAG: hypothetical protein D6785_16535 [Planctomycetota bacterium]